jgi:hypothetical protein
MGLVEGTPQAGHSRCYGHRDHRPPGCGWDIARVGAAELTGRVGNTKKVVDDVVRRLQEQFDCSDC